MASIIELTIFSKKDTESTNAPEGCNDNTSKALCVKEKPFTDISIFVFRIASVSFSNEKASNYSCNNLMLKLLRFTFNERFVKKLS